MMILISIQKSLSSFESDEDFVHIISSSEDDTSNEENFSSVRQWCKIDSSSPAPSRFSFTGQWCSPMTARHHTVRRKWAVDHPDWMQSVWSQVLLTDDFRCSLESDTRRVFV
ncbi:hypothetical protein TNCV_3307981 [Trichonephila clavipes]|nr:hypothetical protein TNCV_3307981 [Trichonephila clavipes]